LRQDLAFTWEGTGRVTEAVRLKKEGVQLRRSILGVDHPHILSSSTVLSQWEAEEEDVGD